MGDASQDRIQQSLWNKLAYCIHPARLSSIEGGTFQLRQVSSMYTGCLLIWRRDWMDKLICGKGEHSIPIYFMVMVTAESFPRCCHLDRVFRDDPTPTRTTVQTYSKPVNGGMRLGFQNTRQSKWLINLITRVLKYSDQETVPDNTFSMWGGVTDETVWGLYHNNQSIITIGNRYVVSWDVWELFH